MQFNLSQEDYEALIALAQKSTLNPDGSVNQNQALALDRFLQKIEKANGITRYSLWIRWQDPKTPLPPTTNFPVSWPPSLSYFLQLLTRPIAQTDVLTVVNQRTPNAVNIMVTPDPAALVGWAKLSDFFIAP